MKALILDFDGLILDTETIDYEAWRAAYAEHGATLPRDEWVEAIGGDGKAFDPVGRLGELARLPVDVEALHASRRRRRDALVAELEPRPGVVAWLEEARELGMAVAIASSSPRDWVERHLGRVRLVHHFAALVTADQVARAKPWPDLYERALDLLGAAPDEALAVEDSPHGVAAARAAAIPCLAVPGPMTRDRDFRAATRVLGSLAERRLAEVIEELRTASLE